MFFAKRSDKRGGVMKNIAGILLGLALGSVFLFSGCMGMAEYEEAYEEEYIAEAEYAPEMSKSAKQSVGAARPSARAASGMLAAAPEADMLMDASSPAEPGELPGSEDTSPGENGAGQKRLRVYSAELELAVTSVEQSREALIRAAEEAGGYIESSSMDYVVIRIPAGVFDTVLSDIEGMGTILSRAVRTADVTEQFSDLQRRISLSERTRERLYDLLERAEETEERVKILREIRRLTEEIERLKGELDSLDRLIQFSRITVRLRARITQESQSRDVIPFPWIAWLDPIGVSTGFARKDIEISPSDDFAVFQDGKRWLAEAAEGTRFKAGAVPNEPRGDTEFWAEALHYHLGDYYRTAERARYGGFRAVLFESKDAKAFYYMVAVQVRGDSIIVAEVFFPDRDALDRRRAQVRAMLEEAYTE